jgi:hypothetical protein
LVLPPRATREAETVSLHVTIADDVLGNDMPKTVRLLFTRVYSQR